LFTGTIGKCCEASWAARTFATRARHYGNESTLAAIQVKQHLTDAQFAIRHVEKVRAAQDASQHLPIVPVKSVVGVVAIVRFEEHRDSTVPGYRELVNQLAQVGTMILTIAPYQLHGAVMLLRARSGQLDRRGVLMDLSQIHLIGPDRGQHHTSQ